MRKGRVLSGTLAVATCLSSAAGGSAVSQPHKVIEFRQYKLTDGSQEKFVELFDREFTETQEALGIRLIGQFNDVDRPDRFTWVREFPNMTERAKMLDAFYNGPVWHQWRGVANPMLYDNDNVLLLREAKDGSGFGPSKARPPQGAKRASGKTYVAVVEYLWKDPAEGFADFFVDRMVPALQHAGLSVLGSYVPEEEPNNFPRLPTRPDRKILVWFTRVDNVGDFDAAQRRLRKSKDWKEGLGAQMTAAEERPAQVLFLAPTPRSALQ